MEQKRKIRYIIVFLLLGGCVVLLCVLNICIGSVSITVFDILASIQGKTVENARILWDIRMPRMLAALILGSVENYRWWFLFFWRFLGLYCINLH